MIRRFSLALTGLFLLTGCPEKPSVEEPPATVDAGTRDTGLRPPTASERPPLDRLPDDLRPPTE